MIDYGVENVPGFLESILSTIFQQDLIELGCGCDEKNGRHGFEALKPLLALSPLTADVHEKERDVGNLDWKLHDAFRSFSGK